MIDELLSRLNLKYEDLNTAERETLYSWLELLSSKKLTLDDVKDHIKQMKFIVENELTDMEMEKHKSLWSFIFSRRRKAHLIARLRNYMLLEAFLESPERAKKALESTLSRMGNTTKGVK